MHSEDITTRFHLSVASLLAKRAFPQRTHFHVNFKIWQSSLTHDALVLSQAFARTPEGLKSIRDGEFTRYWYVFLHSSRTYSTA